MLTRSFRAKRSFRHAQSGNVAAIFAIALVPVIAAMGCAVDYSRAVQIRSKLQSAIDSASVGAVSRTSPGFIAAGAMTKDGPIPAGVTDATNIFNGNMSTQSGYTLNSFTAEVKKSAGRVLSTIQFSADVPTTFTSIIGWRKLTITGSSTSTSSMPTYKDFYLFLDNSPSMGVGATPDDVALLVAGTPDRCAFACHDTTNPTNNNYQIAKRLGIKTRIDVLRDATAKLMVTAGQTKTYTNQFRMAIYDFGATAQTAGLRTLFELSPDLSGAGTSAGSIDLMSVNGQNDNYDQDTPFSSAWTALEKKIGDPGDGTAGAPQKYVFFVSDGVADEANPASCKKPTTNGRCQSPINPSLCKKLTDRGIKVAVLYTTYLELPDNDWYYDWIRPFNTGPFGPSPNSEIARNMKACASPDFYFEVSPTQGISQAMEALFKKAVADARISS
ncbi:MAG: pilus assembly protein [Tardiphaga sp.]|nr:pilus assembly protein [Tardiphaga sp.]